MAWNIHPNIVHQKGTKSLNSPFYSPSTFHFVTFICSFLVFFLINSLLIVVKVTEIPKPNGEAHHRLCMVQRVSKAFMNSYVNMEHGLAI
ncbi:hypothetical protein Lalb_Chr17g0337981 [Lupinus albus]|uniref:Uncharacterized protein n=1 Tax=Lupinus albus TaxID=3870 RepID=A0A6A4P1R9_LUPAL|nr:hypothetical protein Lalb_Chr17g0337981 [Lupinus albus]